MSEILDKLDKLIGDETCTGDVAINTAGVDSEMSSRKKKKKKKKKDDVEDIDESTTLTGGQAGDDDTPPGNIIMGLQTTKQEVTNRLTGSYKMSVVDDEESVPWEEMRHTKGMEDPHLYHDSLKKSWGGKRPLDDYVPDYDERVHKHIKRRDVERVSGADIEQYRGTVAFKGHDRPYIPYVDDIMKGDE